MNTRTLPPTHPLSRLRYHVSGAIERGEADPIICRPVIRRMEVRVMSETRIRRIVSAFLASEYFANWQSENIESGGYARPGSDARDRYNRCYEAAANGADGSTHYEAIQDMRSAFHDWLCDRRRASHLHFAEFPYRLETAASEYFDALEAWHEKNGSLHQEIG